METPSTPADKTQTPSPPIYQRETTGSYWGDVKAAVKKINEIQCARSSLLSGIASGAGVGVIRGMSSSAFVASNWAVGTFMLISMGTWTICRKAMEDERRRVQFVVESMPKQLAKKQQEEVARKAQSHD
ncbi:hypothetical protein PHLGIDRAFT_69076 [Phlebiopsis gigantea 11061_1 CR5-6]|uniref:Cytochrome c oxidase assembly protein COX20, mitochondrial n=1 Tax=Phlebiopsis gigantea (strain 11061_1 CR5-6) TaxID=745531 RepID=A0A0C3SC83_PHLG1|nr:hypothetical protein PHLGIDRAFT_69076 [Phlebiopsis gigantea 11061_1 CR5-6]